MSPSQWTVCRNILRMHHNTMWCQLMMVGISQIDRPDMRLLQLSLIIATVTVLT